MTHGEGLESELDTEWLEGGLPACGDFSDGDGTKYGDLALRLSAGDALADSSGATTGSGGLGEL